VNVLITNFICISIFITWFGDESSMEDYLTMSRRITEKLRILGYV